MTNTFIKSAFITGDDFKLICDSFSDTKNLGIVKYTQLKDISESLKDIRKALVEHRCLMLFNRHENKYGLEISVFENSIVHRKQ